MSDYTANEIELMARSFTSRQSEALSELGLPFKTDADMFEGMLDMVADQIKLCEAGWDLFASTCRLQFYTRSDVSENTRRHWMMISEDAYAELFAAERADLEAQAADFRADARRDAAA